MSLPEVAADVFTIFWFDGVCCDGCTVAVLGDESCVPIERLLTGTAEGFPRLELFHPMLSMSTGKEFTDALRRGVNNDFPFGVIVESAMTPLLGEGASFGWCGEENGVPVDIGTWVRRLAAKAEFVMALGDCAVFGGPHAPEDSNPSGSTGVEYHLGSAYRSRAGLPVIHLPGCAVPPVAIATLARVLKWRRGEGPPLELDDLGRPRDLYQ